MRFLKTLIKFVFPSSSFIYLQQRYWDVLEYKRVCDFRKTIKTVRRQQLSAIKRIDPTHIRCVFLGLFSSVWKYDSIYRLMLKDARFEPIILVCPIVNNGYENMIRRMDECYDSFVNKGYKAIKSYNIETGKYIDLKEDLNPDVIFYTNPYKGLIDERYYVESFGDMLTVYVPYAMNNNSDFHFTYNLQFHNLIWRHYVETTLHLEYARLHSICKGDNSRFVGYPGVEGLIDNHIPSDSDWKNNNKDYKRIIWAPHHTIEPVGNVSYSCFLKYHSFMLNLAEKYCDQVQFVFKPHPLLINKLYERWGKEKTNEYYEKWRIMSNTSYQNGNYDDLFLTSDAMIHDSGSFIAEYLYVNKPVLRTMNDIDPKKMYNSFALKCLDQYYKAYTEQDIEQFVKDVINGVDPLKKQRTEFVRDVLMPKGGMPSENIINDIIGSIEHQRV